MKRVHSYPMVSNLLPMGGFYNSPNRLIRVATSESWNQNRRSTYFSTPLFEHDHAPAAGTRATEVPCRRCVIGLASPSLADEQHVDPVVVAGTTRCRELPAGTVNVNTVGPIYAILQRVKRPVVGAMA